MRETATLCLAHGVAIGAHPSFEDREHFGRRELDVSPEQLEASVRRQVAALADVCASLGSRLRHVKPHGALYNLAARDRATADAIARAVRAIDPHLMLYALADSVLIEAARDAGLAVAHEVFAERAYDANGRLAPRGTPGAVIEDLDTALAQVRLLLREGVVVARDGTRVPLRADTLCLHGDRVDAPEFASALRAALEAEGVRIQAPGSNA
jgi:UPF0271 protein